MEPEDVEISLGVGRRYKLHSGVLARNSTLFAEFLTEANAAKLAPRAKSAGVTTRRMIELQKLPSDDNPAGKLGVVKLNHLGEPIDRQPVLLLNENGKVPIKVFDHYENILNAMNGEDIKISDVDMTNALGDAVEIIQIAEYLGAVQVISKPIDIVLFTQGQVLFRSIAAHHGLGSAWPTASISDDRKKAMEKSIRDVCIKHHGKLNEKRKRLETTISLSTLVDSLCHDKSFPSAARSTPKTPSGMLSPDGGYELYKQLGTAGEAYMDKSAINQFHIKFPMTKKAMNVLENHLLKIKECVKDVVDRHEILSTNCQLDVHRYEVRYEVHYLTCVELDKSDFPWIGKENELRGSARRLAYNLAAGENRGVSVTSDSAQNGVKRNRIQGGEDEDLDGNLDNKRSKNDAS
ncbi:hypothetical protein GQ43DRAFT_474960 [Delitschia confertaspora ATCC 74209]|uniref:BTB domain-containing protein n=1 Tax=Delitschia confertaspora ATCC 74209 TaxID=1513339 RepID=A0A9P4MVG2_9PLEO|nr:hypothetical protein GQ43DRAFT_474960 [Delitschia confertaspora ATCC 74209]